MKIKGIKQTKNKKTEKSTSETLFHMWVDRVICIFCLQVSDHLIFLLTHIFAFYEVINPSYLFVTVTFYKTDYSDGLQFWSHLFVVFRNYFFIGWCYDFLTPMYIISYIFELTFLYICDLTFRHIKVKWPGHLKEIGGYQFYFLLVKHSDTRDILLNLFKS